MPMLNCISIRFDEIKDAASPGFETDLRGSISLTNQTFFSSRSTFRAYYVCRIAAISNRDWSYRVGTYRAVPGAPCHSRVKWKSRSSGNRVLMCSLLKMARHNLNL